MAHLEDNLGAVDIALTDADHARLDDLAEPEMATVPYYHGRMVNLRASDHAWL